MTVHPDGPLVIDDTQMVIQAVRTGLGVGLAFDDLVAKDVAAGHLVRVLEGWCPTIPWFFLFYASRKNQPVALSALVNSLRFT
jgi:DNA-binding transcriptional LysR family regulator